MTVTPRVLLACIAASAVFGGVVGGLATAATQSQASPEAIAAAVQKVKDTAAEEKLTVIEHGIEAVNVDLGGTGTVPGSTLNSTHKLLQRICIHTDGPSEFADCF